MNMRVIKVLGSLFIVFFILFNLAGAVTAEPGDMLQTFGGDGKVTAGIMVAGIVKTSVQGNYDRAKAAIMQPDGKMLVVGDGKYVSWSFSNIAMARYNPDGSLDASFSDDGILQDQNLGFYYGADASAVALLADGRIVVAGKVTHWVDADVYQTDAMVALFTPDGTLDITFNGTGYALVNMGGDENATAVLVQPDGKIVIGVETTNYSNNNFILARYSAAGVLDATFGTAGVVITDLGAAHPEGIKMLGFQDDAGVDKLIAVGNAPDNGGDFAIARYTMSNGALDATFGTSGITKTNLGTSDHAKAAVIQPDGKILVSGTTHSDGDYNFSLARYTANGALDASFGTGGLVITNFGTGDEAGTALALQTDGRIVQSGSIGGDGIGVARFDANGVLDATFGVAGKAKIAFNYSSYPVTGLMVQPSGRIVAVGSPDSGSNAIFILVGLNETGKLDNTFAAEFGGKYSEGTSVAVQADGKIVMAGYYRDGFSFNYDIAVARFNLDGTLDETFGEGGWATLDFGSEDDGSCAVLVQDNGKIIVVGSTRNELSFYEVVIAQFDVNGVLDAGFGVDGLVEINTNRDSAYASDAALRSDGKIIVAGSTWDEDGDDSFFLSRINSNGTLDTTFGNKGKTITDFSDSAGISGIDIYPDGKIVAVGNQMAYDPVYYSDVAVARYSADGVLDASFGSGGTTTYDFGALEYVNSVALQPDGKMVVVGSQYNATSDILIVRLTTGGDLDATFDSDGYLVTSVESESSDAAQDVVVQPDGRIIVVGSSYASAANDEDCYIFKFNPDGTADAAFNHNGMIAIDFNQTEHEVAYAMALTAEGDIIAAGATMYQEGYNQYYEFALALVENTYPVYFPVIIN